MSVTVPSVEFFTATVAPINGSPPSLVIFPFTVVCAYAEPQHKSPIDRESSHLFLFIIFYLASFNLLNAIKLFTPVFLFHGAKECKAD